MEEILTLKEAATLLKISKRTLYDLVNKNSIPFRKVGGQYRFDKKSLIDWVGGESA